MRCENLKGISNLAASGKNNFLPEEIRAWAKKQPRKESHQKMPPSVYLLR